MMRCFRTGKHKFIEVVFSINKKCRSIFDINIYWNYKTDHAGLHCYLSLFKFSFEFNIYDHRHWDHKLNKWQEIWDRSNEEWNDYIGI